MIKNMFYMIKAPYAWLVLVCLILATGCKSTKAITNANDASSSVSAKQVIKQHQKSAANFKTMQAKLDINFITGDKEKGATFNFRMEKDKVIWLSAPFALARMMITPNNVKFYNKGDNTYFDGDYKLLSDFVGVTLDYNMVQNILLGQAVYTLDDAHSVSVKNNAYALAPKQQEVLIDLFYLVNASHYKMDRLLMLQKLKKRTLQVDYETYQSIDKETLPKNITISAIDDKEEVNVVMELKSITLNEEVRFPFSIPSGYKQIEIK